MDRVDPSITWYMQEALALQHLLIIVWYQGSDLEFNVLKPKAAKAETKT